MVKSRRGATTFGCLFTALLIAAGGYFGLKVGQVYWNYQQYQDTMSAQAHNAVLLTNDQIIKRLVAKADSLGLPEDAADVSVVRQGRHITIEADYIELVELPLHVRSFHFTPRAEYDY
jgi:hypothetical protein